MTLMMLISNDVKPLKIIKTILILLV